MALSVLGRVPETPQPLRLFCQDESRIDLHLPAGRRLTLPGVKPLKVMAPLYQYYWLYAAVEPTTGTACWLELLRLDSTCFQVFPNHFSRQYADSLNLLVLDNAPAHVAKALVIPANVVLIYLPPYCPELNPIERLWQDLKGRLTGLAATVAARLAQCVKPSRGSSMLIALNNSLPSPAIRICVMSTCTDVYANWYHLTGKTFIALILSCYVGSPHEAREGRMR